ncbi:hypothetical protein [Streptomyces sp. NBC_01264]|uniref:hypothetical protein n=1 Tax=Streptomyces sp. NBC_01264 TaxID=2903804 RepID=UPI002257FBCC|nr:hypothetical protein [Streptomyces sp. NBC_01264]MCX4782424.1 hypothetical protein [Streptomyces sp. NBC_01264]
MQPIPALRRASAAAAGVVAVVLLVCGGLFTHPDGARHPAGAPAMAGMAGMPGMTGIGGTPEHAAHAGAVTGTGTDGGCSASGQDCPLASAYAPTVQAGPAGDLAGSAIWGTASVAHGRTGPAPPPECSRPRAPDLDSLCVERT